MDEIDEALEILGLPPLITRRQIKERYRQLARRYHPDFEGGSAEEMERINRAYERLMDYVDNFRFRFDEEERRRYEPHSSMQDQFKI